MPRRALPILLPALMTLVALACDNSKAQQSSPTPVRTDDAYTSPRTQWYRDARYGMFIHWGIYAVPAGEWKADKDAAKKSDDPRVEKYVEGQLKPQLRELVTKYDPAILWFDGEWVPWWTEERGREIEKFLIALKPDLVINNRVGKRKM